MVEALLERGVATYALNPKQLDRFRDRHSGAGAKDDDLDAYVLATSLRTDRRLFREISIPSVELMALTALSRTYETLTDQVLAVANQIREQLLRYYPEMRELGAWHEEEWLWHLFEAAPTPAHAARLTERRVAGLLQGHRIRRYKAKDVLSRLRQRSLPVAPGVPEAAAKRVALLLPVLRAASQQRTACSHEMKQLLASFTKAESDSPEKMHHDAALLLSLPGIGVHNGAVMLAEAYPALQQRDYQALRRLAGVAPVSKRTGGRAKKPHVQQRQACSRRLREAFYHWGRIAARYDPRARQHYADLRAKGHSRGRAIRGVTDRLLAVLVAMLRSGQPYNPARRGLPDEIQAIAA
jgi:transposase